MRKKILIPLMLLSLGFLYQCDNDNEPMSVGSQILIVDHDTYTTTISDECEFHNIYIKNNVLYFEIFYGGGCGSVSAKLMTENILSESLPPQLPLKFIFSDKDNCEAQLKRTFAFDLKQLQNTDYSTIDLTIEGWSNPITYNY